MSRNRKIRFNSNPSSFINTTHQAKQKQPITLNHQKLFFKEKSTRSIILPTPGGRMQTQANLIQFNKQRLHHKHISKYRQSFNQNDSSILPFLSSLRKQSKITQKTTNNSLPFEVSAKTTLNQSIRKSLRDINTNQRRLSKMYYQWHNKSGLNIKQSAQFQCALREYEPYRKIKTISGYQFDNEIRPITYKDIQDRIYDNEEIICERQKKLFKMK